MKTLRLQRKLAARILGCGENKVWLDQDRLEDVKEAITSEDIRELIRDKAIKKKVSGGVKARAGIKRRVRKKKGRVRGVGKIRKNKGKRKHMYVKNVRRLRRYLVSLKKSNKIDSRTYNKMRGWVKAGHITNVKGIDEKVGSKLK